jgi:hypothetical protein
LHTERAGCTEVASLKRSRDAVDVGLRLFCDNQRELRPARGRSPKPGPPRLWLGQPASVLAVTYAGSSSGLIVTRMSTSPGAIGGRAYPPSSSSGQRALSAPRVANIDRERRGDQCPVSGAPALPRRAAP